MLEIRPYLMDGALRSSELLAAAEVTRETLANAYRREVREVLRFGQARATCYAARQNLPGLDDVSNWSDNYILVALSRRGEDLPGNLIIGRESFDRFQQLQHEVHTENDYPRLGRDAIAGEHVGSSAGGEQPKFTAYVDGLHRIALLDAYGAQIANGDRHHHNVALFPAQTSYDVAPAFDQLPMAYAPPASGNLRNEAIRQPHATVNTLEVWDEARDIANEFWRRASELELSGSMQAIVREHAGR